MSEILQFTLKDFLKDENLRKAYVVVSKTESYHNKDLNELPNIKAVVRKYITSNPFLADYPIKILPSFPNAYYNMNNKVFTIGLFNASIIAHELEHALNTRDSEIYKALLGTSKLITSITSNAAFPLATAALIGKAGTDDNEMINRAADIYGIGHGVASLPILYEEGKANLFALLNSPNKWDALKTLGPAYSTYLGKALLPLGMMKAVKES